MTCRICDHEVKYLFTKKVLHKYDVGYHQCVNCSFIQTDDPFWLDEAYKSAINHGDIGTVSRSIVFSEISTALLRLSGFDRTKNYLDYGAGYGLYVRMMRDNGYNFFWYDEYCDNLFADKFVGDLSLASKQYEVLTSFEVFEHLPNPIMEIEKMLSFSDSILFSTNLVDRSKTDVENWWYIAPMHGQHISFYHTNTLKFIAKKYGCNLYSRKNLHFLTKKNINNTVYKFASVIQFARMYNTIFTPSSLNSTDFQLYLKEYEKP